MLSISNLWALILLDQEPTELRYAHKADQMSCCSHFPTRSVWPHFSNAACRCGIWTCPSSRTLHQNSRILRYRHLLTRRNSGGPSLQMQSLICQRNHILYNIKYNIAWPNNNALFLQIVKQNFSIHYWYLHTNLLNLYQPEVMDSSWTWRHWQYSMFDWSIVLSSVVVWLLTLQNIKTDIWFSPTLVYAWFCPKYFHVNVLLLHWKMHSSPYIGLWAASLCMESAKRQQHRVRWRCYESHVLEYFIITVWGIVYLYTEIDCYLWCVLCLQRPTRAKGSLWHGASFRRSLMRQDLKKPDLDWTDMHIWARIVMSWYTFTGTVWLWFQLTQRLYCAALLASRLPACEGVQCLPNWTPYVMTIVMQM